MLRDARRDDSPSLSIEAMTLANASSSPFAALHVSQRQLSACERLTEAIASRNCTMRARPCIALL
jgi:hypothetical protein